MSDLDDRSGPHAGSVVMADPNAKTRQETQADGQDTFGVSFTVFGLESPPCFIAFAGLGAPRSTDGQHLLMMGVYIVPESTSARKGLQGTAFQSRRERRPQQEMPQDHGRVSAGVQVKGFCICRFFLTRLLFDSAHSFVYDFGGIRGQGYFAIFDGHAGKHAAEWCGEHFHQVTTGPSRVEIPCILR